MRELSRDAKANGVGPSTEHPADSRQSPGPPRQSELACCRPAEPCPREDPALASPALDADTEAGDRRRARRRRWQWRRRRRWRRRSRRWGWWWPRRLGADIDAASHTGVNRALVLEGACIRECVPIRLALPKVLCCEEARRDRGGVVGQDVVVCPAHRSACRDVTDRRRELVPGEHLDRRVGRGTRAGLRTCSRSDDDDGRRQSKQRGKRRKRPHRP
jgi:hypothetical protein